MKRLLVVLLVFVFLVLPVDAVSFTMTRGNSSTGGCIAMDAHNTVYRGDWVCFTDTTVGATSWEWSFGDGFTSTEKNPRHNYTFGKQPILMKDGYKNLSVGLKVNGAGATAVGFINFTTLMHIAPRQVATIATMNETFAENYTRALHGDNETQPGWAGFDWVLGIETSKDVYTSVLTAPLFMLIVFSIPFIMNWIISKDFVVSGVLGGFLGIYIIARLPANMQLLAIGFIVASVVAVVYSLTKDRE